MFRSKPTLWGSIIGLLIIINLLSQFFMWVGRDVRNYYLSISDNFNDNVFLDCLMDNSYLGVDEEFKFIQQMGSSSDIIIGYNLGERKGYITYDDFMFTPMVGFVIDEVTDKSDGFSVNDSIVEVDLRKILDGLLAGKDWQDIGIHKDVLQGPIQICIPSEYSDYYDSVYTLFMQTYGYSKESDADDYSEESKKR